MIGIMNKVRRTRQRPSLIMRNNGCNRRFCLAERSYDFSRLDGAPLSAEERDALERYAGDYRKWIWYVDNCGRSFSARRLPNGPCGLCAIWDFCHIQVDCLKIVGREAHPQRKLMRLQLVKTVADRIAAGESKAQVLEFTKDIRNRCRLHVLRPRRHGEKPVGLRVAQPMPYTSPTAAHDAGRASGSAWPAIDESIQNMETPNKHKADARAGVAWRSKLRSALRPEGPWAGQAGIKSRRESVFGEGRGDFGGKAPEWDAFCHVAAARGPPLPAGVAWHLCTLASERISSISTVCMGGAEVNSGPSGSRCLTPSVYKT